MFLGNWVYHISPKGSDENTCGDTMNTACRTLQRVLHLYYNSEYQPALGLEIITATSLVIDHHLMVRSTV